MNIKTHKTQTPKQYAVRAAIVGIVSPVTARQHIKSRPAAFKVDGQNSQWHETYRIVCDPSIGSIRKIRSVMKVW